MEKGKTVFCALLLTAAAVHTARCADFPALKVSKGEQAIVLIGSQHAGQHQPGRAEAVDVLVAASSAVCLESDPHDLAAARSGAHIFVNPSGVQLRDLLTPATYAALRSKLSFLPPGAANIDNLSPYSAATLATYNIPSLRTKLVGQTPGGSLDADIVSAATRHGKRIAAIEPPDAVAASFAKLSDREWAAYTDAILRILDCAACATSFGTNMARAHSQLADYEEVAASIHRAFASEPNAGKLYRRMYFDKRNADMARAIEQEAIERGRCSLVAIGIGHLGGDAGVVQLLRRAGMKVEPLSLLDRRAGATP